MEYTEYIKSKALEYDFGGIDNPSKNPVLFEWQQLLVTWALRKGRSAIFAMTGLGKTLMQLEWARQVADHTGGIVLILAPLSVAAQTVRESNKFGFKNVRLVEKQADLQPGVNVTNYHKLDRFTDLSIVDGIVIDESSILKNFEGKFKNHIIEAFEKTPFKLACTATPAPNDYMELGNHAEFLGVMSRSEMLSMFFVHDGGDTSQWRLKGHAKHHFWRWICSWSAGSVTPALYGWT